MAELSAKTGRKFMPPRYLAQQRGHWPDPDQPDAEPLDLHRPAVDELTWPCAECGKGTMRRVPEVADCWFDSGSMPVAQWHYPFENRELFNEQFPADFICEAIDQTRGWFYTLHAVSTLLFDQPYFKNVHLPGSHRGRGRQQDVQEPRQRGGPVGACSMSTAPTPHAGTCSRPARPATRGASPRTW